MKRPFVCKKHSVLALKPEHLKLLYRVGHNSFDKYAFKQYTKNVINKCNRIYKIRVSN